MMLRGTEEERLQQFFDQLPLPEPPSNWKAKAKPCKWLKQLQADKTKSEE
jgi:hypothetical protein